MIGSVHAVFGGRERCNHNLRFRHSGKSSICLICHCAKIDDLLNEECTGNRKLSSACISEIIHQFRIVNSVLDVPIEPNYVEMLLSPVLQTAQALLKIHHDEVGTVVAQALDKICQKIPLDTLENFLENLSAQILEKTSFGNLESLLVLIRRKECLNSFLKNHGAVVLPKLFQQLEKHVDNIIQWPTDSSTAVLQEKKIPNLRKEALKIIEKLLDVLQINCPDDVLVLITDNGSSCCSELSPRLQSFTIFSKDLKSLIMSCIKLLNLYEVMDEILLLKILSFLEKLSHQPETLRCLLADSTGLTFCSMLKRLLFLRFEQLKIAALSMVHRMVVTYKHVMDDSSADRTFITDLPSVISQVDLIHFICEAMTTSSGNLFRIALQVLDQISTLPLFEGGRMIPALESVLRISRLLVPDSINSEDTYGYLNALVLNILHNLEFITPGIQHQLIYLFERLPTKWTGLEYLPWVKLLLYCSEAELRRNLWSTFNAFVQRSKNLGNCYCVSSLKCVLLIAYALIKGKNAEIESSAENSSVPLLRDLESEKKLMEYIMDDCFLPCVIALVSFGKSEDSEYVTILLELLINYPVEHFKPCSPIFVPQTSDTLRVKFDSEPTTGYIPHTISENSFVLVQIDQHSSKKVGNDQCWSVDMYMQILGSIRLNAEFLISRKLFEFWNKNVARMMSLSYHTYLPQLKDRISQDPNEHGEENYISSTEEINIERLLDKLHINAQEWAKSIGSKVPDSSEMGWDHCTKQMDDIVLAFYFFYGLFARNDVVRYFDNDFTERFCQFLNDCIEEENLTQQEKIFDWEHISYYFRIALIIASSLPHESAIHISEQFERFLIEVTEAHSDFKDDVMIYDSNVFKFLLNWKIFPDYVSLVKKWLHEDRISCAAFYANGNFDDQLNAELNNSLITLAAQGDKETSSLALELGGKRMKRYAFSYDFTCVKANMHNLMMKISLMDEKVHESIDLIRFSNVIKLAVNCENGYLTNSENSFPVEFFHQFIHVMLNFKDTGMISRYGLELLCKIVQNETTLNDVNQYLISHEEFIKFLGTKLEMFKSDEIEESIHAHKFLAVLIEKNLETFRCTKEMNLQPWINWELTSILSYIHEVPRLEILDFLVALFKTNFICPIIQVAEINQQTADFTKLLMNLLMHMQALTHKVTFTAIKERVWEILYEFLRLADPTNEVLINHMPFQLDVLFQPWIKVILTYLLAKCIVPSNAPIMALEFLNKWTRMILQDKLENTRKRSHLQQMFVSQSYVGMFKTIRDAMKSDVSQTLETESSSQRVQETSQDSLNLFDIESKCVLISKITKNCDIFLASIEY